MTYYAFSALLNCLLCTGLSGFVLLKSLRGRREVTFALFSYAVAFWSAFYFLWMTSDTGESALRFVRVLMYGAIFIPAFFFHYNYFLTQASKAWRPVVWSGYLLSALLAVSNVFPLIVLRVEHRLEFPFWPVPGPFFHLHLAQFGFYLALSIHLLLQALRNARGIYQEQLKYSVAATMIGFGGGMTNYMLWYNVPVRPYGNILVSVFVAIIAYSILRLRLLNINLAFRYVTISALFASLLAIPLAVIAIALDSLAVACGFIVLMALFGPFLFAKLRDVLSTAVDYLPPFRGKYLSFDSLREHIQKINQARSLQDWHWKIIKVLREMYGAARVSIFVRDEQKQYFLIKAGYGLDMTEGALLSLPFNSPVVEHLEKERGILLKENLRGAFANKEWERAWKDLDFIHGAIAIPIFYKGVLRAIVSLDDKENRGMYNTLDLSNLGNLARAAEHTLQNFLSGLSNEQLTAVWAHDLLKPFTRKGSLRFITEILNGTFGNIDCEMRSALELVENDVAFVSRNLSRLLHPGDGDPFDRRPSPLTNAYLRMKEKYVMAAAEGEVKWKVIAPPDTVQVLCDMPMIEHRVLANLVENAFRYVGRDGDIELGYRLTEKTFVGYVKDSGQGIKKEDFGKIFELGQQLDEKNRGLAGLGLFSVRSVAEAHGGKVWFESEPGKGSCFYFELPLAA